MQVELSEERRVELVDYANRHGQDPTAALDEILASALEWERQDFEEAVEGIRSGYADVQAGRTRPVAAAFEEALLKYDLPR